MIIGMYYVFKIMILCFSASLVFKVLLLVTERVFGGPICSDNFTIQS